MNSDVQQLDAEWKDGTLNNSNWTAAVRAVGLVVAAMLFTPVAPATAAAETATGWVIEDLSKGWGDAQACSVGAGETRCWGTEAAMDSWLAKHNPPEAGLAASALSSCSNYLRMYEEYFFGGRVLQFRDRGYWQNLADYSFDNRASSWKVGSCSVRFAMGASGSGSTLLQAAGLAANAPSGWNDVISSLRIS